MAFWSASFQMAIETVPAGVELAAQEPGNAALVEVGVVDLAEVAEPFDALTGLRCPKTVGVGLRLGEQFAVVRSARKLGVPTRKG